MAKQNQQITPRPPASGGDDRVNPADDGYEYEIIEEVIEDDDNDDGGRRSGGGRGGCGWGVAGLLSCLLIPLAVVAFVGILGVTSVNAALDGILAFFRGEPRQATVETSRTILNAVQTRGTLETVDMTLVRGSVRVSIREGFQNACGYNADYYIQGTIEAGVELGDMTPEDVSYDAFRETYVITLPAPVLTSCRIDQIQEIDRSATLCGVTFDNARQLAGYTSLTDFRDEALEIGRILDMAQDEAESVLYNLLSGFTEAEIELRFATPDAAATLPPSCDPLPPPGWTYNPQTGAWSD